VKRIIIMLILTTAGILGVSVGTLLGDQCTEDCFQTYRRHLRECKNEWSKEEEKEILKDCIEGAKLALKTCLELCLKPKPKSASIEGEGFLPNIKPSGASYMVNANIDDPCGVVDHISFYLTHTNAGVITNSLLGTDTSGTDGWSVTFSPQNFSLSEDSTVIIHMEVLNSSSEGVAGDGAVAVVEKGIPTVSEWGLIIMAMLLLVLGAIVIQRRLRPVPA